MAGSKVPMDVKPAGNAAPVASLPRPNSLLSSVDCDARRQQSDRWCQETQVMIAMPELKLSRLLESELAKNRGGCDRAVIVFEAVDGFGKLLDRRGRSHRPPVPFAAWSGSWLETHRSGCVQVDGDRSSLSSTTAARIRIGAFG